MNIHRILHEIFPDIPIKYLLTHPYNNIQSKENIQKSDFKNTHALFYEIFHETAWRIHALFHETFCPHVQQHFL